MTTEINSEINSTIPLFVYQRFPKEIVFYLSLFSLIADVKTTWKTSGLYDRHAINLTFDPDEEMKECRTWHNYWRENDKKT